MRGERGNTEPNKSATTQTDQNRWPSPVFPVFPWCVIHALEPLAPTGAGLRYTAMNAAPVGPPGMLRVTRSNRPLSFR